MTDLHYVDLDGMTPLDRIEAINTQVAQQAADAPLRQLAGRILRHTGNIPARGPFAIARWVRRNILYLQEAPFVEVLQGPYTTMKTGVGDCDDLAALWVALTRAAGLETYVVGVAQPETPDVFYHAIGYDSGTKLHFELTDDRTYGGAFGASVRFTSPAPCAKVFYAPEPGREGFYLSLPNGPYRRVTRAQIHAASANGDPTQTMSRPRIVRAGSFRSTTQ